MVLDRTPQGRATTDETATDTAGTARPVSVSQERVTRHWLAREATETDVSVDPETAPARAVLDELLSVAPGAATFLGREQPIDWYQLTLDREQFDRLRPVAGPEDLLWRAVSTDGTLRGVAERLHRDGPGPLAAVGIDTDRIEFYRDRLADGDTLDPLVIRTRRGATPWYVADGDHRATATALRAVETERYDPLPAFVGVTPNPVVGPLVARIRGVLQRLRGKSVGQV